jgi:phage repressor protein C with HTH and peptisase S24 domain
MKKKPLTAEQLDDAKRLKAIFEAKKKELGYSQESLGHVLGIGQSAVASFLNGVNPLNVSNAAAFAKELKVTVQDFSPDLAKEIADIAQAIGKNEFEYAGTVKDGLVPVVGEAVLGVDGSVDMIEFRAGWLRIYSADKDAYGLKVKGDSMWPRIQSGEYVVIEPNTPVHPSDEVFVRTVDGHNMIKIMNKTRDGNYQFSSVNSEHRPITLAASQVEKMHFVSAIVKATRYVDNDDLPKSNHPS